MADIKEYWNRWLWRDAVTKVITINTLVWLVIAAGWVFMPHWHDQWLGMFALPATFSQWAARVWTIVTYMFAQADFLHLLVNMMCFLIFGQLFFDFQGGNRTVVLYIYGGVAAALTFLTLNSVAATGYNSMLGASCAVLAIIGATTVLYPHYSVNLLFFGSVKLLWLAVASLILLAVQGPNLAEGAAHGVGLLVGVTFGLGKRRGFDITSPVNMLIKKIADKKVPTATPYMRHSSNFGKSDEQEMDILLAKVSRSGYSSLTPEQRQRLFDLSHKMRR